MRIIAAIDLIDGSCVRLSQGDFNREIVYGNDPLALAKKLEDHGIRYLHLVDLDGAREGKIMNLKVLETIAAGTGLKIDFSGGIRTDEAIRTVFSCGASQVTCGSIAVTMPELFLGWLREYGADRIILGADFRNRKIATGGWQNDTDNDLSDFLMKYRQEGVRYAICTDIGRDGMLKGPSVEIYKELTAGTDLNIIASGGVSSAGDIRLLDDAGCEGVIIGKSIMEGKITFTELDKLCLKNE